METNKILEADMLDIVFDGRNKDYGAYQLRKTYNRRLGYSLAVMFGVALVAVGGTVLGKTGVAKRTKLLVDDVTISAIAPDKVIPPPVTPPPPKDPPKVEIKKFTPPNIVKQEVKDIPPPQDELDNTTIGTISQAGVKDPNYSAPPVDEVGTVAAPPKVEEDIFKEWKNVQIQAQFPGGPEAWQKYLSRNLRVDVPTDNGAPPANYAVVVSFLVNRDGNISEVRAENDPGFGIADEAVRVITRGPKWVPAIQNGRNVIYRQKQSIVFQVNEGQ